MPKKIKISDETLMQQTGAGNEKAFAELVHRHLDWVVGFCYRRLGVMEEAEEAAQEIFTTIWRSAASWQAGQAKFTTWLYRVAANKSIDKIRRRKPTVPLEQAEEPKDPADDGFDQLAKKNDRELLRHALNKLSQQQKEVIELVYFAQMKQKDAADALGVTLAALESHLRRGREKLAKTLKKHQKDLMH